MLARVAAPASRAAARTMASSSRLRDPYTNGHWHSLGSSKLSDAKPDDASADSPAVVDVDVHVDSKGEGERMRRVLVEVLNAVDEVREVRAERVGWGDLCYSHRAAASGRLRRSTSI